MEAGLTSRGERVDLVDAKRTDKKAVLVRATSLYCRLNIALLESRFRRNPVVYRLYTIRQPAIGRSVIGDLCHVILYEQHAITTWRWLPHSRSNLIPLALELVSAASSIAFQLPTHLPYLISYQRANKQQDSINRSHGQRYRCAVYPNRNALDRERPKSRLLLRPRCWQLCLLSWSPHEAASYSHGS